MICRRLTVGVLAVTFIAAASCGGASHPAEVAACHKAVPINAALRAVVREGEPARATLRRELEIFARASLRARDVELAYAAAELQEVEIHAPAVRGIEEYADGFTRVRVACAHYGVTVPFYAAGDQRLPTRLPPLGG